MKKSLPKTDIPWADKQWPILRGCSPASEGCQHTDPKTGRVIGCYAKSGFYDLGRAERLGYPPWGRATFFPENLDMPLHTKKPCRVFVAPMSDLYHETVDDVTRSAVMEVIGKCQQHVFILLTKRPQNIPEAAPWFPNVWLGVTAENQELFDRRWEMLLCKTAYSNPRPTVLFLSAEPMLGAIRLSQEWTRESWPAWTIAGPETGPKARRCEDAWIDALLAESPCAFDKRKEWKRREFPMPNDTRTLRGGMEKPHE